jgi:hypothetical protein
MDEARERQCSTSLWTWADAAPIFDCRRHLQGTLTAEALQFVCLGTQGFQRRVEPVRENGEECETRLIRIRGDFGSFGAIVGGGRRAFRLQGILHDGAKFIEVPGLWNETEDRGIVNCVAQIVDIGVCAR